MKFGRKGAYTLKKYGHFFKSDLRRAVTEKGFVLAMLLIMAVFLNSFRLYVRKDGSMSTFEIIVNAMALSGFGPFAAVFPAMGYSSMFCQEFNSGYIRMITTRMSYKRFMLVRLISVGLSGGLTIGVPFAVYYALAYVTGYHGLPDNGMLDGMVAGYYLEHYGDLFVIWFKILLGFLFGVMFSVLSLIFAALTVNRYASMLAPFIIYEMLWALLPLKFKYLNPIYLLRGDDVDSYVLSALMELIYMIFLIIIAWFVMKKRISEE